MHRMIVAILLLAATGPSLAHSEDMPGLVHAIHHGWWLLTIVAVVALLLPAFRRS